ncbi:hypothetical protein [Hwanghaeella sp. LZ110]|uniref:hypothetical protein n=1 Tax=Hwanghaeella sp. LZ110 TaxID=3402810 RepID=UPI003B66E9DA
MKISGGQDDFSQQTKHLGIELSNTFSGARSGEFGDEYFVDYNGRKRELVKHLKKGNDKDQRNCLRIYFFWDEEDQVVVIGYLPAHLRTRLT